MVLKRFSQLLIIVLGRVKLNSKDILSLKMRKDRQTSCQRTVWGICWNLREHSLSLCLWPAATHSLRGKSFTKQALSMWYVWKKIIRSVMMLPFASLKYSIPPSLVQVKLSVRHFRSQKVILRITMIQQLRGKVKSLWFWGILTKMTCSTPKN